MHRGIVQVSGAAATISPDALRTLAREFEPLQGILIRHEQVLLAHANAWRSAQQRIDSGSLVGRGANRARRLRVLRGRQKPTISGYSQTKWRRFQFCESRLHVIKTEGRCGLRIQEGLMTPAMTCARLASR
jgi:hypothetical protein